MSVNEDNVTGVGCGAFDADTAAAYLEGLLAEPDRELYESHLRGCPACRAVVDGASAAAGSPYSTPRPPEREPDAKARGPRAVFQALGRMRGRTIAAATTLSIFGGLLALGALAFLVLAGYTQTRKQPPPTGINYGQARPIPPAPSKASGASALSALGGDDDDDTGGGTYPPPTYRPGIATPPGGGYPALPMTQAPSFVPPQSSQTLPTAPMRAKTPAPQTAAPAPAAPAPGRPSVAPLPRTSAPPKPAANAGGTVFRRVGGKTFKQNDEGFLVDTAYRPDGGLKVVEVVAGSPDYMRLLDERKDLGQYFRLSDRLVVVLDDVVYRVVPAE